MTGFAFSILLVFFLGILAGLILAYNVVAKVIADYANDEAVFPIGGKHYWITRADLPPSYTRNPFRKDQ